MLSRSMTVVLSILVGTPCFLCSAQEPHYADQLTVSFQDVEPDATSTLQADSAKVFKGGHGFLRQT